VTFSALWAFLAVGLPVLAALIANLSSVDLAYHLRAGGQILDGHGIPTIDTYTFTAAGQPWLDQQWAAQAVLAAFYRLGGWSGLAILRALLVAATFGATYATCRGAGLNRRTSAWLTIGVFVVAAPALALRPQLLAMALFALTVLLVSVRRRHPTLVWLIVPLTVVWANVHGSFFLGPVVLLLAWIEDRHERRPMARLTLAAAVASVIAANVTPFGPAVWTYAAGLSVNSSVVDRVVEWQPTSLRSIPGMLFFASALLVVLVLARRGRLTPWPLLLWLAVFFGIGVYAIRGIAWWPLAAVLPLAGVLAAEGGAWTAEPVDRPRRLNAAIAAVLVAAGVALLPMWRPIDAGLQAPAAVVGDAPSQLTAVLRSVVRPGDRIFNPQVYGSWLEFAVPEALVAIDSRIEIFSGATWRDYDAVSGARGDWSTILDRWNTTLAVTDTESNVALTARLAADPGWKMLYSDNDVALFARIGR
jgi:hypothetical protein